VVGRNKLERKSTIRNKEMVVQNGEPEDQSAFTWSGQNLAIWPWMRLEVFFPCAVGPSGKGYLVLVHSLTWIPLGA